MTSVVQTGVEREFNMKPVNVGRIWLTKDRKANQPVMTGQMDRDFSAIISLGANDRFSFWPNNKREGSKDADFSIAIELPTAEADALIETLNASRGFAKSSNNSVDMAIASLELPH